MARPTANLRLFAAIYAPQETARQMLKSVSDLRLPAHRLTTLEQVHMTVQFIGDTPASEVDATMESVERSTAGLRAFSLTPARLITLPQRGPARLIAAETDAPPALLEIHRRLVTRLARNVRARQAERFTPHLTLCRFRSPARGLKVSEPLSIEAFEVTRIVLMRSTLSSSGATHHEMLSCELATAE